MSCQQELMALGKPFPRTCQDCGIWGPCRLSVGTVSTEPEALRLARELKVGLTQRMSEAAAELRRLHQSEREGWRYADELEQERERLHAANEELLGACQTIVAAFDALPLGDAARYAPLQINAARAAIAKATGATTTCSGARDTAVIKQEQEKS